MTIAIRHALQRVTINVSKENRDNKNDYIQYLIEKGKSVNLKVKVFNSFEDTLNWLFTFIKKV